MEYTQTEILQTIAMTEMEHLDIRTVTLSLSLRDCATDSIETTAARAREKIERTAERLVSTVDEIGDEIGIRIANKRIAVTPISMLTEGARGDPVDLARAIDESARVVAPCASRYANSYHRYPTKFRRAGLVRRSIRRWR